jgi:hypothetical protein
MQGANHRLPAAKGLFPDMAVALKASRKPIKLRRLAWAPPDRPWLDRLRLARTTLFAEIGSPKGKLGSSAGSASGLPPPFQQRPGDINPISV